MKSTFGLKLGTSPRIMSSSSTEFDGGPVDPVAPAAAVAPAVPLRRYAGKLVVFFVVASAAGMWEDLENGLGAPEPCMPAEEDLVVGAILGFWQFVRHEDMPDDDLTRLMLDAIHGRRYQLARPVSYGYLVYRVAEAIQLVAPLQVARNLGPAALRHALGACLYRQTIGDVKPGPQTVAAWLHCLSGHFKGRLSLATFVPWLAAYVLTSQARVFHCVIVTHPFLASSAFRSLLPVTRLCTVGFNTLTLVHCMQLRAIVGSGLCTTLKMSLIGSRPPISYEISRTLMSAQRASLVCLGSIALVLPLLS